MKINELKKQIQKNKEKLQKLERDYKIKLSNEAKDKRRKRARHLIMLGALFEIEDLDKENAAILLGFLHENKDNILKNKHRYLEVGERILNSRKNIKIEENKEVGKDEMKELLELVNIFKIKNKDLGAFIQEKFNKKLFQNITIAELKIIKDYIKDL